MSSHLIKLGGIGAVLSGALLIVQEALGYATGVPEAGALAVAGTIMYALHIPLVTVALLGWHARQADAAGRFGAVALVAAVTGQLFLAGLVWPALFLEPALREVAPALLDEPPALLGTGFLVSLVVYALGWLLFGIATLRAGVLPRPAAALLTGGVVVGFVLTEVVDVPGALWPWYAAWIWLGVAVLRSGGHGSAATGPDAPAQLQPSP